MGHIEIGSDFYYCNETEFLLDEGKKSFFDNRVFSFFLSGRAALSALLNFGINQYGWNKVYVPSYYCHEVTDFLMKLNGIEIAIYDYNPKKGRIDLNDVEDNSQHAFINVNFFGINRIDTSVLKEIVIIEDCSHDLLSLNTTNSDFAFASLRKQLPVPVGGVIASKKNITFEPIINNDIERLAIKKTLAMFLKREYLKNAVGDKDLFRKYYVDSEEEFSEFKEGYQLPTLAKNILNSLDVIKIINKKTENLRIVFDSLQDFAKYLFYDEFNANAMGLLLYLETYLQREYVRRNLIENSIYPAVLWPNQKGNADVDFQNRFLFIHVDYRYSASEISCLVKNLKRVLRDANKNK